MNFADIWNTSQEDYYILFNKWVLSYSSYFLSNMASIFDNFILGHTVLKISELWMWVLLNAIIFGIKYLNGVFAWYSTISQDTF